MTSLMLYHHPLSVCSMKVRLALEEKGLTWSSRVIDIIRKQEQLDPWYLKLNPKGVIPTLEVQSSTTKVLTDSAHIIRSIASLSEGNDIVPSGKSDTQLMDKLINLADDIDLQILSYAHHPSMEKSEKILNARASKAFSMAEQYPELKDNYLVCAERSENSKVFRVDRKHIERVEQCTLEAISFAEKQFKGNNFLLGNTYTLADVIWTVVLSRLDLLGYGKWLDKDNFPEISRYYLRMQHRKSYTLAQIQNEWWDK
ncbi:glutathione S-transferase family protein [Vibrio pectenicida]|uniref:glutathione S-transferase family protein n=1 Tax=Vibrio pectenicida TaxID=62763 RepID=UPI003B9AC8F0